MSKDSEDKYGRDPMREEIEEKKYKSVSGIRRSIWGLREGDVIRVNNRKTPMIVLDKLMDNEALVKHDTKNAVEYMLYPSYASKDYKIADLPWMVKEDGHVSKGEIMKLEVLRLNEEE